jgi:hypothetical protein
MVAQGTFAERDGHYMPSTTDATRRSLVEFKYKGVSVPKNASAPMQQEVEDRRKWLGERLKSWKPCTSSNESTISLKRWHSLRLT